MVLFFSLVTSPLISGLGIVGTFAVFAVITFVGGFYFIVYMRSTQGLSSEACKVLFYPDDLKPKTVEERKSSLNDSLTEQNLL